MIIPIGGKAVNKQEQYRVDHLECPIFTRCACCMKKMPEPDEICLCGSCHYILRLKQEAQRLRNVARGVICYAMQKGRLLDLSKANVQCVDCGKRALVWDHRDYTKPMLVDPVCYSCNGLRGQGEPKLLSGKELCLDFVRRYDIDLRELMPKKTYYKLLLCS
jgi:hypothetical protein